MAVRDHVNRIPRMRALVTMVDTANGFVECIAKDGTTRRLNVREQFGSVWRWPQVNEEWMISEQNGTWQLGERFNIVVLDPLIDPSYVNPGDYQLDLAPDQQIVLLDKPGVVNTKRLRHTMARKYVEVIGDGTTTTFFINHMLSTRAITYSIVGNIGSFGVPQAANIVTEVRADSIKLVFSIAPVLNEFLVTVIG